MLFKFLFPRDKIHHATACLIQGLHGLGHEIHANYRPTSENVLSNAINRSFSSEIADYVHITSDFSDKLIITDVTNGYGKLKEQIDSLSSSTKVVAIDMDDMSVYHPHNPNLYLFLGHYNSLTPRNPRTLPLAFGLSEEIISTAELIKSTVNREGILHNFRPTPTQDVRNALDLSLVTNLEKYFKVNRSFSGPKEYPVHLSSHQAVLCYGGQFYQNLSKHLIQFENQILPEAISFSSCPDFPVIHRFDSWRLYEAALFGAAPIALNFEKYGFVTGANPRAWVEYIPVEFDKVESLPVELAARLKDDPEFLIKVGQNARRWVIDHHSPLAAAKRFISQLKEINIV